MYGRILDFPATSPASQKTYRLSHTLSNELFLPAVVLGYLVDETPGNPSAPPLPLIGDSGESEDSKRSTFHAQESSKETAYEDATVHYAACVIGWVVLKAPANQQPEGKPEGSKEAPADRQVTKPYVVEFSRDKAHLNYLLKGSACKIRAIDDGGLDLVKRMNVTERLRSRVVLLEAKAFTCSVRNRRNAASEEYARRRQNDGLDVE
ncbi:hypothetical protein F4860DRAFT_509432 [Xylaria cubensis]|nr:hypothetical protein F4860DRAFT_509432 [Xylaria cubensis]